MSELYADFLRSKTATDLATGLAEIPQLHSALFPFQRNIVAWALRRGRAAIFADCGLGKTLMQLEWANHVPGRVLILTPLAVAAQTIREGERFHIPVGRVGSAAKIHVCNYEQLHNVDCAQYAGIVLDESSILKAFDGKTRTLIIDTFKHFKWRLACTATPSPNDFMELGNHAEFLGVMTYTEMLSMFFVHDGGDTQKWRLKGHAEQDFWKWICSWAVNIRKPSDLGYDDGDFTLPELHFAESIVKWNKPLEGQLFQLPAQSLQERIQARKETVKARAEQAAAIVRATPYEQWIIWCNLNSEADEFRKCFPLAQEIRGSDSPEKKETTIIDFIDGQFNVLVTKPSICGYGLNLQCCRNVIFLGLSDSYEDFYQAIRRCWRFGQKKEVSAHIVIASTEGEVLKNIKRKEEDTAKMADEMVKHMSEITKTNLKGTKRDSAEYKTAAQTGKAWTMTLGDCVECVADVPDNSIHYSIFSPPFSSLYTYSNSERDMGNCTDDSQFMAHFKFLIKELYRVLMPGRLLSFHCMNLPTTKTHHGYIGIRDFRGELIRAFEDESFIYHSEVVIWKDPVTAMQRTKALGLLHKQLKKDSCMSRQGIPDYLVTMRKPGDNPEPVTHTNESFPVAVWQRYASPVWMDINPSDTLQHRSAREHKDEKHICPLQLQVISRALELWTNPGDLVLSPFAGIGSEGFQAVKLGRRFMGFELKESYYHQACKNLLAAESENMPLFNQLEDTSIESTI